MFVAGFCVHDAIHHPAGVEHVHHKHPHNQGSERCFKKHDAGVVSLRRLCQTTVEQGHMSASEKLEMKCKG